MPNIPTKSRVYQNHMLDSERWLQIDRRDDDIIVATPYKCGTTWMQNIVINLLFQDLKPRQIASISPWIDSAPRAIEKLRAQLDAQTHRRVLKSHLPLDGFYYRPQDKYIVVGRDQRDVFMSFWNHYSGYTDVAYAVHNDWPGRPGAPLPPCPEDIRDLWNMWIARGWFEWEVEGYPFWSSFAHVETWWQYRHLPNILFVHYNDLLADLNGGIKRIAKFLDIQCSDRMRAAITKRCTFKSMKQNAEDLTSDGEGMFAGGAKQFINKGTNGRWKSVLTDGDLAQYQTTAENVLSPDCRAWLEGEQG